VLGDGVPAMELVLPGGGRAPVTPGATIGRDPSSTVRLSDPSVSRAHARVVGEAGSPALVDAGSAGGTWIDGRAVGQRPIALHDGAVLRLGDAEVIVERTRSTRDSGRTVMVPRGASALTAAAVARDDAPRLRSGYALKRQAASEGPRRWVLQDLESGTALRLDDDGAAVLGLLDGERSMDALLLAAEDRLGPEGPARLASLLAELAERGLLSGIDAAPSPPQRGGLRATRSWAWPGAADAIAALYVRGGWRLATSTGLGVMATVALTGLVAFVELLSARNGQPFVVADRVGLGGIVFFAGRFLVAAAHETAHGLALTAVGRRVREAGLKLVLVFPYAYVDTSEAWLEPARRRIAVSAAGPASDLVLGGAFSLVCLASVSGALHDVMFQLAMGAYLGAAFNLNPFVERDGYHVLVDVLREPGLRARAREALVRRVKGEGDVPRVLWSYGALGLLWTVVAAALVIAVSLRMADTLRATVPEPVVAVGLAIVWMLLLAPIALLVGRLVRARA
jgi:putative peptide zinc metalloprotease protein